MSDAPTDATSDPSPGLRIGFRPPFDVYAGDVAELRRVVARAEEVGIDHLCGGDHVSYKGGKGFDGIVQATAVTTLSQRLSAFVSVYLLPLRHPVPVARQIASLTQLAPGRLVFGVGLGGDDRHEMEICDVDPSTRGRRFDSSLRVLRGLLSGETVSVDDEFFSFDDAEVLPSPPVAVPIIVGGRSDAALRRTAELGDGWLGLFVSARRFAEAIEQIADGAAEHGRADVDWRHGMHVWCCFGERRAAEARLADALEGFYRIPFDKFRPYAFAGTPAEIAESVRPYIVDGCQYVNFMPANESADDALDALADMRDLLAHETAQ